MLSPSTKDAFLQLSATDSSTIKRIESDSKHESPFSIDVIIIGSQYKTEAAQTQLNTWASHESVRHLFIATESDDPDQTCDETMTNAMVDNHVRTKCGQPAPSFPVFAMHPARYSMEKKNDVEWVCAQRRFAMAFTKVVEMYAETQSLPDYLIVADDETSVNVDHIAKLMIHQTQSRAVEVKPEASAFPQNPSLVWAGCRTHLSTRNRGFGSSAYGGYGTYFNKESLRRLIKPLHCDGTATEFEKEKCAGLKPKSNINKTSIGGENEFFQSGDSINRMMHNYVRNVETVCLHSDWFIFKACGAPWNVVEW